MTEWTGKLVQAVLRQSRANTGRHTKETAQEGCGTGAKDFPDNLRGRTLASPLKHKANRNTSPPSDTTAHKILTQNGTTRIAHRGWLQTNNKTAVQRTSPERMQTRLATMQQLIAQRKPLRSKVPVITATPAARPPANTSAAKGSADTDGLRQRAAALQARVQRQGRPPC